METTPGSARLVQRISDIEELSKVFEFRLGHSFLDDLISDGQPGFEPGARGVEVALSLSRSGGTVFARGSVRTKVSLSCVRCLGKSAYEIEASIRASYLPARSYRDTVGPDSEIELAANELDVSYYEGDTIDLREIVAEAIILEIPAYPSCSTVCAEELGARGEVVLEDVEASEVDPRWAPLLEMTRKNRT